MQPRPAPARGFARASASLDFSLDRVSSSALNSAEKGSWKNMPTAEQNSWTSNFLGFDVGAVGGAIKAAVQSMPGNPMLPDCKPVKGKVPGPAQHLLCATHGHILDIKEKKIIAISLEQYKSQKMGGAKPKQAAHPAPSPPAATAAPAQAAPPPPTATAAPAQPPSNGAASSAGADAAKAQAEAKRILNGMQLEAEDIASVQADHEKLAGGGRVNRAVSWISDKLGGADDPGDDLAEIAGQIMREQIGGIAAVGSQDLDAARKHLAAMKALNQKAHVLWQKYSNDTGEGGGRAVTGLEVVSKAGDVATMGLNVVAPGVGQALSVAKNVSVAGSKLAFGQKVNWTEFTIDMAFDLFVGGEGSQVDKLAEKVGGPLAKKLAPKLSEAIAKKWGLEAVAKKLGGKVTEEAIEKYILTETEELIKDNAKKMVTPIVEKVVDTAKDKDITNGQLVDLMLQSMTNPSGPLASGVADKIMAEFKP
jgi:hypothetical protein